MSSDISTLDSNMIPDVRQKMTNKSENREVKFTGSFSDNMKTHDQLGETPLSSQDKYLQLENPIKSEMRDILQFPRGNFEKKYISPQITQMCRLACFSREPLQPEYPSSQIYETMNNLV